MISINKPGARELMESALDISEPKDVQIVTNLQEDTLWVNVDGICVLRISKIADGTLHIERPNEQSSG